MVSTDTAVRKRLVSSLAGKASLRSVTSTGKTSFMRVTRPEKKGAVVAAANFDTSQVVVQPRNAEHPFDMGNPG